MPTSTSMPASFKICTPLPATKGLGSGQAITTRATPASTKPLAHGGVRP